MTTQRFLMSWKTLFYSVVVLFTSCAPLNDSGLRIDGGTHIDNTKYTVPGVFNIISGGTASCTAQFVSNKTAITAAHCIPNNSSQTCISTGVHKGKCTSKVYIPNGWNQNNNMKNAYDMAVLQFDNLEAPEFYSLRHQDDYVRVGEKLQMVGYSNQGGAPTSNAGSKNWGENKITELLSTNITLKSDRSNGNTVSPGDSGGGAFISCSIVGVASRMGGGGDSKINLHTNLMWQGNFDYLKQLPSTDSNVYICGLHGWDSTHCPLKKLAFENISSRNADDFICQSVANIGG